MSNSRKAESMLRSDGRRAQPLTRSSISARLTGVRSTRGGVAVETGISGNVAVVISKGIVRFAAGVKDRLPIRLRIRILRCYINLFCEITAGNPDGRLNHRGLNLVLGCVGNTPCFRCKPLIQHAREPIDTLEEIDTANALGSLILHSLSRRAVESSPRIKQRAY